MKKSRRRAHNFIDISGRRFGRLRVLRYTVADDKPDRVPLSFRSCRVQDERDDPVDSIRSF